jgi:thiamine-phosphate pyrophosphorylase
VIFRKIFLRSTKIGRTNYHVSMVSRLYPILDVDCLQANCKDGALLKTLCEFASELVAAGVTILQYRAKNLSLREMLSHARELRRIVPRSVKLVMNDRADLCLAAGFDGVHVGQDDLSPRSVREIIGPNRLLGVSTHNLAQFATAMDSPADYLAIGPVFPTASKLNPDPVVGLDMLREARSLLAAQGDPRPLVAIGGITQANAAQVFAAGADSVAVISDLVTSPRVSAEAFLAILL